MVARKGVNRYPRPGERLAPSTLFSALLEPAPPDLVAGTVLEGCRLCDLDETVWEKLPRQTIHALAQAVVLRVAKACARKALNNCRLPRPPAGLRLDQFGLETRTFRCLAEAGYRSHPERLGDLAVGDLMGLRSFGPRCLVDLLSALEAFSQGGRRLNAELTLEAELLAALPGAALASADDPRFGKWICAVDEGASTAKELAQRLLARTCDPPDTVPTIESVRQLRQRLEALTVGTLEDELIQVFASAGSPRNREILISYYGWKDGRTHTLAEIGARYGMTRERTRQICAKLVRRKEPAQILAPVLDRTLALVAERLPRAADGLEAELRDRGLTRVGLGLSNLQVAAQLLGREVPFVVVGVDGHRLAVRPGEERLPPAVAEAARKQVFYRGVTTVDQVAAAVATRFDTPVSEALVLETVQLMSGFGWLDRSGGWFRLASVARHGLPKAIEKTVAVAGRISIEQLAAAVARNRRLWRTPVPTPVLLEFCRQTPGLRVEGDCVLADPPLAWDDVLTGIEAHLVRILREYGPIMERGALEDLCVSQGINRFSFNAFLATSPVIAQYGPSVYGLVGADISPAVIEEMVERQRAQRAAIRVLEDHGQTADGRIWLGYRLSKAASTYAVITVPAALKDVVTGKFDLISGDGRHVGTLAARDGRAWGLGAFLRQQGARIDTYVRLTFDLHRRQAVVTIDGV